MSKKAKGRRTEKKVEDYFIDNGYIVDKIELGGKFRKFKDAYSGYCLRCWQREEECCSNSDPFDGFDIIAINEKETVFCQVKSNRPAPRHQFIEFGKKFSTDSRHIVVATWYDRKGLRLQYYNSNGTITEKDFRK